MKPVPERPCHSMSMLGPQGVLEVAPDGPDVEIVGPDGGLTR